MRCSRLLVLLASLVVLLLASNIGITSGSLLDTETSSGNTFQAWTSSQWVQTTQAQFEAGVLNNVDTFSSPGDIKLASVLQEPTTTVGSEAGWNYPFWSRRAPVTINNPGSGLSDYQVRINVAYDADMQPDFDDIRFRDSDDLIELSHWRESYTASTSATFWVKVPSIPSGAKTIYMYYGNAAASSASNGTATFVFFDDFESGNLNKWTMVTDTFWSVATDQKRSGGYSLKAGATSSSDKYIVATGVNVSDLVYESWWYVTATSPDICSQFRAQSTTPYNDYHINWEGQWTIAKLVNGTWTSLNSVSGTLPTNTWFKTTIIIKGSPGQMKFLRDDIQINPASGWLSVGTDHVSGTVGHRAWTANNNWWIDDVRARKYADPEPTTSVGSEGSWYYASWNRRAPVTINNSSSGLTEYQVKVNVTYDADMQPDFDDIRFVDSNDSSELSHWRESYIASTSATFWVKVPSVPSGTKTIYMYYGNAAATSASNGSATFDFFDDFSGDLSKWTTIAGTWAIDAGRLTTTSGTGRAAIYGTGTSFGDAIIEFKSTAPSTTDDHNIGSYHRGDGTVASTNAWLRFYWDTQPDNWKLKSGTTVYTTATGDSIEGVWRNQKIVMVGNIQQLYVDGTLKISYTGASGTNPGKVGVLSYASAYLAGKYWDDYRVRKCPSPSAYVSSGTIASQVLDTGIAGAKWNALFWDETLQSNTDITFEVRASDTLFTKDAATPSWISVGGTSPVTSGLPSGRYMQWRATLTTSDASKTPTLHEVRVYYY